jgi:hypothetical protein
LKRVRDDLDAGYRQAKSAGNITMKFFLYAELCERENVRLPTA